MNRMESDPQRIKYAGQPTAQGVCEEVRYYLDRMEDLPIVDPQIAGDWENGREVPKGARIFSAMGYNVRGDLCVEVSLRWLDEEEKTYKDDFFYQRRACPFRFSLLKTTTIHKKFSTTPA